ncbi:MAG: hypothetical protein LLG04_06980 [Parachlamydia sp.]|nr:hypothetical protein [Parachlamydia sp.]
MNPTGDTAHIPPAEPWRAKFKRELDKLEASYWVIRQPIKPTEYERVVTDIQLQCQTIFSRLGELDTLDDSAKLLNYISEKNQQIIHRIEKRQSGAENTAAFEACIQSLWNLEKRVMDIALNLAIAHEESANSLTGRMTHAAGIGLDLVVGISQGIPIMAQTAIKMTDEAMTAGVNQIAAQYLPAIARGYAPDRLLQGRYPDMKSFARAILSKVTAKKVSSVPMIGDSRKVHRVVEKSARKVTSFDDKLLAPLQQKLFTLTAPGNFQQMLGRALISTALCLELIQEAEKLPGDLALRKEFLIRRLLPGASLDDYAKRMDKQRDALMIRFLGGSDEKNLASKVVQELLIRFSRFSGLTNLIIATTVETLTQMPQPARLVEPQLGQTLAEMHQTMQRDYPLAAELLKVTGGWEKMRALEHYADIASIFIQNQLLEKAIALVLQPKSSQTAQTAAFDTAMRQLIDTVHSLVTNDKTWDHYWLRLFTRLPKQQILKRVDWNRLLAEPLRVEWHQWIAGK